jgi:hypothetical protein
VGETAGTCPSGLDAVVHDAHNGKLSLSRCEALRGTWVVEENEEGDDGNADRGNTLDDEEPTPAGNAVGIVKVGSYGASEDATKSARENGGSVKDGEAFAFKVISLGYIKMRYIQGVVPSSAVVYQQLSRYSTPGKKPASIQPSTKRKASKAP